MKPSTGMEALPLYQMFSKVPKRYDLLNCLHTWGLDRAWRRKTAQACLKDRPEKVLDLCTGTGDMAVLLKKKARYPISVTAADFSGEMLKIAREKARKACRTGIVFSQENAAKLSFRANSFDAVTVSFGFRNLTFKNRNSGKHLSEILRVLKPGGRLFVIESSQPKNRLIRKIFHFYIRAFIAPMGRMLSGYPPAYEYLARSMLDYYDPEELKGLLLRKGFVSVKYRQFMLGAVGLVEAWKGNR